jgi:acetylglutamate kinase
MRPSHEGEPPRSISGGDCVVVHAGVSLAERAAPAMGLATYLRSLSEAGIQPLLVHAGEARLEAAAREADATDLKLHTATEREAVEVALDLDAVQFDCAMASEAVETPSGMTRWLPAEHALQLIRRRAIAQPCVPKLRAAVHAAQHGVRARIGSPAALAGARATTVLAEGPQDAYDALRWNGLGSEPAPRAA